MLLKRQKLITSNFIWTKSLFLEHLSNNYYTNIVCARKIEFLYKITCCCQFFMLFFQFHIFFFTFCVFPYIIMYTLNIIKAIKKRNTKKVRDSIYENYCKWIGFSKEESYFSLKRVKKKGCFASKEIDKKCTWSS